MFFKIRNATRAQLAEGDVDKSRGTNVAVKLIALLSWLYGKSSSLFSTPFWQLLHWMCFMIDQSGVVDAATSDPLLTAAPRGPTGRKLARPQAFKFKVATIAAQGKIARSGRGLMQIMQELLPGFEGERPESAKRYLAQLSWQYLHKLRRVYEFGKCVPIYSVSWDATRLSKRDTLIATIYNAALNLAAWMPPQAFASHNSLSFLIISIKKLTDASKPSVACLSLTYHSEQNGPADFQALRKLT